MPVTALFLWTSAAETNSLQLLYSRLSALPPPAVQALRAQKHILSYRALRPINSDPSIQNNSIYQISLPHHQVDPNSLFWIHDDVQSLSVIEMGASFTEIQARMDTGWQDRQGATVTLEGRGFEWGRDWRIWCANLKQANRYRGVVVEVQYVPSTNLPQSKILLTQFAERHIFRTGEVVRPFWGKRIYLPSTHPNVNQPNGTATKQDDVTDKDFEEWHTAMQYMEMIQYVAMGRRRSSAAPFDQ